MVVLGSMRYRRMMLGGLNNLLFVAATVVTRGISKDTADGKRSGCVSASLHVKQYCSAF